MRVDQDPPIPQTQANRTEQRGNTTNHGVTPSHRFTVHRLQFDCPGTHAQRLPAMDPEPSKKNAPHENQAGGIERISGAEGLATAQEQ